MAAKLIYKYGKKLINIKMASIGALIMGFIVFYINLDHGVLLASTAGMKQAVYTFFMGGILLRILETIAIKIENPYIAIPTAVLVTSVLTICLVYSVHSMKGTPKPFESTIPTILTAPIGFLIVAARGRRKNLGFSRTEYYLGFGDRNQSDFN